MNHDDSYKALAAAIVIQAITDYRSAKRKLIKLEKKNPYKGFSKKSLYKKAKEDARNTLKEIDDFFRSEYCYELCHRRYSDIISLVSDIDDPHIEDTIFLYIRQRGGEAKGGQDNLRNGMRE